MEVIIDQGSKMTRMRQQCTELWESKLGCHISTTQQKTLRFTSQAKHTAAWEVI